MYMVKVCYNKNVHNQHKGCDNKTRLLLRLEALACVLQLPANRCPSMGGCLTDVVDVVFASGIPGVVGG